MFDSANCYKEIPMQTDEAIETSRVTQPTSSEGIGASLSRVEDERLLRGAGQYVTDLIALSDALHVKILRSPHAFARIVSSDLSFAWSLPGVVSVITADALKGVSPVPCDWIPPGMSHVPEQPILAVEYVRYVGQPVIAVAAATEEQAKAAVEALRVYYDVLPAVSNQEAASQPGAPQLHVQVPDNVAYRFKLDSGDVSKALSESQIVVKRRYVNSRVIAAPMEGRAVLSSYDRASGVLTQHSTSQRPHFHAQSLSKCLRLDQNRIRFLVPDIGGAFGVKLAFYPEDVICGWLSMNLGTDCAWVEGRAESFLGSTQGRDQIQYVELGANEKGMITSLRCRVFADLGAYAFGMGPGVPAINTAFSATGQYNIPHAEVEIIGVYTNRMPTGPYRGAGHPEATFMIERALDELAAHLGIDPAELRIKNYVSPLQMPYTLLGGLQLDTGHYAENLNAALELSTYGALRKWQRACVAQGRYAGVGVASFSENSGVGPSAGTAASGFRHPGHESARLVMNSDTSVSLFTGAQDSGQGHATALAQIAGDILGISSNRINVIQGNTITVPTGSGTFNSRTMAVAGSAVFKSAQKLVAKLKRFAALKMECPLEDVIFGLGVFRCSTNEAIPPLTVTEAAYAAHFARNLPDDLESGLDETSFFEPKGMPGSYGSAIAAVEVDSSTGHISLLKFVIVDDCGRLINPLLAEGQVHGGAAQGIGQALMEGLPFGAHGEILVHGFQEYAMPRAGDLPDFLVGHTEVPTFLNPLGAKGAGEGSTVVSTAALVNAVVDALRPLGVKDVLMPMTPMNVWRAIQAGRSEASLGVKADE